MIGPHFGCWMENGMLGEAKGRRRALEGLWTQPESMTLSTSTRREGSLQCWGTGVGGALTE